MTSRKSFGPSAPQSSTSTPSAVRQILAKNAIFSLPTHKRAALLQTDSRPPHHTLTHSGHSTLPSASSPGSPRATRSPVSAVRLQKTRLPPTHPPPPPHRTHSHTPDTPSFHFLLLLVAAPAQLSAPVAGVSVLPTASLSAAPGTLRSGRHAGPPRRRRAARARPVLAGVRRRAGAARQRRPGRPLRLPQRPPGLPPPAPPLPGQQRGSLLLARSRLLPGGCAPGWRAPGVQDQLQGCGRCCAGRHGGRARGGRGRAERGVSGAARRLRRVRRGREAAVRRPVSQGTSARLPSCLCGNKLALCSG